MKTAHLAFLFITLFYWTLFCLGDSAGNLCERAWRSAVIYGILAIASKPHEPNP